MDDTNSNDFPEIRIIKGGPIKVTGKFSLTSVSGDPLESKSPTEVYLCACGRTKNKPFCDGSHSLTKTT